MRALVDLEAGAVIRSGTLTMRNPEVMSFSPDGRHVDVSSARGEVLVLDTVTGTPVLLPAKVHRGSNAIAYSADGSLMVATGADGAVSLHAGDTGTPLGTIAVPNRAPINADFQSDGHTLLITAYDDAIYRWDTRVEHAIAFACQAAGRDLTEQEWQENFSGRPYRTTCS